MKLKDWNLPPYEFGRYADGRICLAHRMEDLVDGVSAAQGAAVIARFKEYTDAIWWLIERVSPDVEEEFLDIVARGGGFG